MFTCELNIVQYGVLVRYCPCSIRQGLGVVERVLGREYNPLWWGGFTPLVPLKSSLFSQTLTGLVKNTSTLQLSDGF